MTGMYGFLKKKLSWENADLPALLSYNRYISLLVTSLFYLIGPPQAPLYFKAGAVFCLLLEAYIFIRVYNENGSQAVKRLLVLIETIGLAFILIITGGLDSPFVWYAINPILLSATLRPTYYCWLMMTTFLVLAISLQRYSLYTSAAPVPLWPDRSFFFTVFFLSTFAAQLFSHIIAKLSRQAAIMEKQLEHIKALYEAIEVFSHHNDPHEVASLFASYSRTLTGAKKVIVWIETPSGIKNPLKESFYTVRGPKEVLSEEYWYPFKSIFENRQAASEVDIHRLQNGKDEPPGVMITVKIKSSSNVSGVLSAYYLDEPESMEEVKRSLTFLADLCAWALEKRLLASLAEEFLLMEEKARIAGELNDKVTQNIFGLIYGLDTLIKNEPLSENVCKQLRLMQKTAQKSLKDLRTSIYCMSSAKSDEDSFISEIEKYLLDLSQLNNVAVEFNCTGNFASLNALAKQSLDRMVREATGNAIRHGACDHIRVSLTADEDKLSLVVADNGSGFEPDAVGHGLTSGLGLINMKELARSMGGELIIESKPGEGTVIRCITPLFDNKEIFAAKEGLKV